MSAMISLFPQEYGKQLTVRAFTDTNGVPGAVSFYIGDNEEPNQHSLTIFTYNQALALELADVINQIVAKHKIDLSVAA